MKGPFLAICLVGLTICALAQTPEYPHAYPREGATEIFQNERVIVWEVVWPDGLPQPYHRHRYDMTGVFLRWGPLKVTRPDGTFTVSEEPFEVPSTFFLQKGVTHKEEGIGQPERHSIMIDMKDVNGPPPVIRDDVSPAFPHAYAEQKLDAARMIVWDVEMTEGQRLPVHVHPTDTVAVALGEGTVRFDVLEGEALTTTLQPKDIGFYPAGTTHAVEIVSGSPRMMVYELKNQP